MHRIVIIAALFGLMISGIADAQTLRRTYSNFRKLESYARRVDEIVKRFNDRRAAELMQRAQAEIEQARYHLFDSEPPEIGLAQVSMLRAKRYIDLAARNVLEKPFGSLKLQLDELIDRAEKSVMQVNNDEANYLLNQAKKFRRRAYESYNNENPVKAQEYYRVSYFFAKKCLDYTGNQERGTTDQLLDLEISVQQMLEQGGEMLRDGGDPYLLSQLAEAQNYYDEALEMADRGDTEQAVRRLRLIKRLLYRLFDQAERGGDRIADDLYALRVYLESLNENTDISGKPRAAKLLKQAERLYGEAENAYRTGDHQTSTQKIALSQRIANQLFRFNRNEPAADPADLSMQLEETRRVLELQGASVQESRSASAAILHQDALRMLEQAEEKLSAGQHAIAFQLIQAAARMSVRLQKELKTGSETDQSGELLKSYNQVADMLARIRQNERYNEDQEDVLAQIALFAETGKAYLDQGELIMADEYLKTAMQQIKQFTARWRKEVTK